ATGTVGAMTLVWLQDGSAHMPEQLQQERIIVADDHPVFRDGLCRIAQRVFPQACILEAADMDEVLSLAQAGAAPSLFRLDLLLPAQTPQGARTRRRRCGRRASGGAPMAGRRGRRAAVWSAAADGAAGKATPPGRTAGAWV